MNEARFENPKGISAGGFGKAMQGDVSVSKTMSQQSAILDRFRALVKEREDEVRVSEDDVVSLSADEVVRLYEVILSELTFNSKPIITDLTIIAGEQREHGEGIADAICARILEVPVEQKLPSLYLLDSIVKNIGKEYATFFSARLPEVFCEAYRQVHPNMYPAMRHLFGTWSTVFPSSVLKKIEACLQFSPTLNNQSSSLTSLRASESPRPTHGIHVNPKYLEARRQFGHATAEANVQPARASTSTSKMFGQKLVGYDEYNSDNAEVDPSQVGAERLSLCGHGGRTSPSLGSIKLLPSSAPRIARSSSPYGVKHAGSLSSSLDDLVVDSAPGRAVENASPSDSGFDYGFIRVAGRHEQANDRRRNILPNDTSRQFETSATHRYYNEIDLDRPRALIDAYGTDERQKSSSHKHLKVDHLNVNGIHKSVPSKTWQTTEEEEFNWEDMSPALVDSGRSNDISSSSFRPPANFRTRPGFRTPHTASLANMEFRSNRSNQVRLSAQNDSFPSENILTTSEGFDLPRSLAQSSQHHLSMKGGGRNLQMLSTLSSAEQGASVSGSFQNADVQIRGPPAVSRIISSGSDPSTPGILSAIAQVRWPPANHHPPSLPSQIHERIGYQPDTVVHQGYTKSNFPVQQSNPEIKPLNNLPQFSNQQHGLIPLDQQITGPMNLMQPQPRLGQELPQNMVPPAAVSAPSHLLRPSLHHGYIPQMHGAPMGAVSQHSIYGAQSSIPIANESLHLPGGGLLTAPRVPPPVSSQMLPISQNPGLIGSSPPTGGAFSGLINSLMAQGVISLNKQAPMQDSVGLDFNQDHLKVRHKSSISALYDNLPRQCTTCGLRFRSQEEHRIHMDWHVTKNRLSKNRKQNPSRKWYVSYSMWLSSAETLGTDAVPGFLPTENAVEKNDDEEMAVPADDDQKACALCGEPFDDFYSDETEEWMYKGAVYMNEPSGSTAGMDTVGMDRSKLGPIVHAKCRSETGGVSAEDFRKNEVGFIEEGRERKRLRT